MAPIPTYEAGRAFVQVNPSLRNFQKKVSAEVAKIQGVTVPITAQADTSRIRPAMAAAAKNPPVAKLPIKPEIDPRSQAKAEAQIGAFAAKARARIEKALRALPEVELNIKSTEAESRLQVIRNEIARLGDKRIGVDVDSAKFEAELTRLRSQLAGVAGHKTASIQVKTDAAAALTALETVSQRARRLDGDRVNINVNAQDVTRAIGLVGLLTAALAGVSAAGAPALAVLAAIPALGGVAVQGIGALGIGLSGVSDAVKALQQEEVKAAAGTAASAASRVNSAQAIQSALRGVRRATEQATRASITGDQQVGDAKRALADVETASTERISAAERDLTEVRAAAAKETTARERDLRQAQQASTESQLELNGARLEAIERLEDLGLSLRGVAIDEREALIDLKDAQVALAEGVAQGVSGDDLQRLQIRADRAQLSLDQTRERFGDLRQESDKYARSGIEGSREVVAAQKQVSASAEAVASAQAALTESQVDNAQRVIASERAVTAARVEGSRQTEAAELQVQRAIQQAGWAQADAARAVEDSQIALSNAYADAGQAGAASANQVAEAMANLSPEAQRFARFLSAEVLPGLRGVRAEVQRSLLPRLETSLRNGAKLAPVFAAGLRDTGQVIGDLTVRGSEMMTSGPWRSDFGTILSANNRILDDFGTAGLFTADAMRHVTVTSQPMLERFSEATMRGAEMADQWLATKRATGELDAFFDKAGDTLAELAGIALQVVTGAVNITNALGPLGMVVLHTVGAVAELVGEFAQAHPTITQVIATGLLAAAMFVRIGATVGGLVKTLAGANAGWAQLTGTLAAFGPAAVEQRLARMTGLVDAQGVATARATTSGGKFVGTLTRIGSALPVVGVALIAGAAAWDGITVSSDEAADALNKGGVEAEESRRKIDVMQRGTEGWLGILRPFITTQDEATAAAKRQRDEMGPLARAQSEAEQAAADHQLVLRDFSPVSEEGKASAQRLAEAQDALEREQRGAAEATKSHTDRILEQQGVMQGALGSDLAYREALEAVNVQLRELAGVSQLSTEQSNQLEGSMIRAAEAAKQQELANYTDKTSFEAVSASNQAFNQTLLDLIGKAGTQAPQALLNFAGNLTQAELKAIGARIETDRLGNSVLVLPGGKHINITTSANTAEAQVHSLHRAIDAIPKDTSVRVVLEPLVKSATGQLAPAAPKDFPGLVPFGTVQRATGGPIHGPGTTTSDSILLRASDDEHMWSAAEVDGAGGHARVERLRALALAGRLPAFAQGGAIGGLSGGVSPRFATATGPAVGATLGITDPTEAAKAFGMIAEVLDGQFTPALQLAQQAAGIDTATALQALLAQIPPLTQATVDSGLQIQTTWAQNTGAVIAAQAQQSGQFAVLRTNLNNATLGMIGSVANLQARNNASWLNMQTATQNSVGYITGPVFGGLHGSMTAVEQHAAAMRSGWAGQLAGLQPAAANPIRWIMKFPLGPPGIAASWNNLDAQFRLGKHLNPPAPGFATGGEIKGSGTGTSDSIVIRASDGEFIVREEVASRVPHFLKALNAGQAEAIQAAGGTKARMPGFALGGVVAAQQWARGQQGKPYIWGGVGPRGYDCSGFMSAITNVLRGQSPHRRLGVAGSQPWPGFRGGLQGAFATGFSSAHTAGTLGGINVEAGGSPSLTKFGAGAAGADSSQFPGHAWLPEVGGVFASGGQGGGSGFDPTAMVEAAFRRAYELVADTARFHGGSDFVTGNQAVARQAVDAVKGKALEQLAAMFAASGLGPLGAGAPFYVGEISRAAKARGLGADGATIGVATSLVETNLRNLANRAVPASLNIPNDGLGGDHDSIGLFQQRQAGWGTVQQRMNPFASAGMFFDRLRSFNWRAMDPGAAAQRVQVSAYPGRYSQRMGQASGLVRMHGGTFDQGGWLPPGYTNVYNGTGNREVAAVFNRQQWRDLRDVAQQGSSSGITNTWNLFEVHDANETAMKIQRRQELGVRTGAPL